MLMVHHQQCVGEFEALKRLVVAVKKIPNSDLGDYAEKLISLFVPISAAIMTSDEMVRSPARAKKTREKEEETEEENEKEGEGEQQ